MVMRFVSLDRRGRLHLEAFQASWICDHRNWQPSDGVVLLPVGLAAALVVTDLHAAGDLDAADEPRIQGEITSGLNQAAPPGTKIVQGSPHRCIVTESHVVVVAALSLAGP